MKSSSLPAITSAMALLVFVAVMFFPALFQGKVLAPLDITTTLLAPWNEAAGNAKPHNHNPSDAVTQYLPYRIFAEKSLSEDGYIGWNPFEMGGYNLAGNTMALPGSWPIQLHRFLAFKDAWNLGIFAEFLIAGSGMLVFLRGRKLPWLPCLIGAVAYMFNSQFVIWIYHRWALGSFCWMPWVMWSLAGGFRWPLGARRQILLPCFLALAMLGGSLQHFAFVFLACGCLFAGGIGSPKSIHKEWQSVAGWSCAFLLAIAMAAFSLVPQVSAYLINISIGHTRGGLGYTNGLSQPFFQSLLIPAQIWPWMMGDPQTIDGFRIFKSYYMDIAYLGTIPMVLAVVGVFHKGMPSQAKWLILIGLLIPLTPLVGPLYHRVQLLFLLGGSWMTAEMLARSSMVPQSRLMRVMSVAVITLGMFLLAGTLLPSRIKDSIENQVVAKSLVASNSSQFGADKAWIKQRARSWTARFSLANPRTASVYGLLVVGTAGLLLSMRRGQMATTWGNSVILGATSLELLIFFQTWTTFSNPRDLVAENPAIEKVRLQAGPHRVSQRAPEVPFANIFATPNMLSAYAISSVDAYESIQYRSSLVALAEESPEARLSLAGVGVSIQPAASAPQEGTAPWPVVETTNGYVIRKNPDVPAPIISGTGRMPENPKEILASFKTTVPITPASKTMNRWAFTVPEGSNWIRIAQNWHEGWRWRHPGQNWQSFKNGLDAACWIDEPSAANRQIEVRFFPRSQWLTFISLATALMWLGVCLFVSQSRKPILR